MEGKWFAESTSDAAKWGKRFYQWNEIPFYVVQVDIPDFIANQMYRIPNLDNIGAARWADEANLLKVINSTNNGIIELSTIMLW